MNFSPYMENYWSADTKRKITWITLILESLGILGASGIGGMPVVFNAPVFGIQTLRWGYIFVVTNILFILWVRSRSRGY